MSGWRATVPTERLFGDPRFLMLDEADQALLLRLYARCDKWGRGPAHPNVLAVHLCLMRRDVREQLDRLGAFVDVYAVAGHDYYEIRDYDADAMRETLRKRGPSNYPGRPDAGPGVVGVDNQAGLTPQKSDTQAGLTHSKVDTQAGRASAKPEPKAGPALQKTDPNAGLTPQKTGVQSALVRARQRSESGERERDERSEAGLTPAEPPPASPAPPAWTPPPWPTPEHERAAERFVAAIRERTGHPAPYKPSALAELAVEHAAHFVAAVAEAERLGVGWKGWHVQQPRNWLRTLCVQAAEESTRKRRAPPPSPEPPVLVNGMPPITDAEREAYEQLVATSPFPKFVAERERRARLKAEQAQETA